MRLSGGVEHMTERTQHEPLVPLQVVKRSLEEEIQKSVDGLQEVIVSEQSDLHTMQFRLATEGAFAFMGDIPHRPIRESQAELATLLLRYCDVCAYLGVKPRHFFPHSGPIMGTKEGVLVLHLP
jgi:hypothetical protein